MERTPLFNALKKVSPALSSKALVEVLECLCFDGETVTAYDDQVALRLPLKVDLRGAVRGALLIDWLAACRAKEVELSQEGPVVTVKAGRAKLETPALPEDTFLFKAEPDRKAVDLKLGDEFVQGLARVAVSMGTDPTVVWQLGVTLHGTAKTTTLYACNLKTAARVKMPTKGALPGEVVTVFPPRFVELVLAQGNADPLLRVKVGKDLIEAEFASGLRLYSRVIAGSGLDKLTQIFEHADTLLGEAKPLPKGFAAALDRHKVLLPHTHAKSQFSVFSVRDGKLRIRTDSEAGKGSDAVPFEGADIGETNYLPDLARLGVDWVEELAVTATGMVMTGGKFTYLVGAVTED